MSYGSAVRESERPVDNEAAGRAFNDLYDRYVDTDGEHPPTDRIAAYVAALLERRCHLTEDVEDTSPWATGPLIGEARGPGHLLSRCSGAWPRTLPPLQRLSHT